MELGSHPKATAPLTTARLDSSGTRTVTLLLNDFLMEDCNLADSANPPTKSI